MTGATYPNHLRPTVAGSVRAVLARHPSLRALPLSALTLAIWSGMAQGAVECGYPTDGIHNPPGAYLWQLCSDQSWRFAVTGDGTEQTFTGQFRASGGFSGVSGQKLENDDRVNLAQDRQTLDFAVTPNRGADGLDFSATGDVVLALAEPAGAPVYVGAQAVPVTGTFDLQTLAPPPAPEPEPEPEPEPAPQTACGRPDDMFDNPGAYLYRDCASGAWILKASASSPRTLSGQIVSDQPFASVQGVKLESNDRVDTSDPLRIDYALEVRGGWDELHLRPDVDASLCVQAADPLWVGPEGVTLQGSFDPSTLQACASTPPPGPAPEPEPLPTLAIGPANQALQESAGQATLRLSLSAPSAQPVSTRVGTLDGTATAGGDFTALDRTVSIPVGQTGVDINVPLVDDRTPEPTEAFSVQISDLSGAEPGRLRASVSILDDDPEAPTVALAQPGPHPYLDDVDSRAPILEHTGQRWIDAMDFPRIGIADSPTRMSDEALSKWPMIATQNPAKIAGAQKINPDLIYLRFFNPIEFQSNIPHAMPFDGTGPATENGNVFAGHWVYQAGSRLTRGIDASASVLQVEDASRFDVGYYLVIYDAPAGSFANAEHMKITGVNRQNNTVTVNARGYKSRARAHASGSIVAQHATVNVNVGSRNNWMYNHSLTCPRDANGNQFSETMVAWAEDYYDRLVDGRRIDIRVDGFHFDTDRYIMLGRMAADVDNDLRRDDGILPGGDNVWGKGLENFYALLREALPDKMIVGGGSDARGIDSINGTQIEGFPVASNSFGVRPDYSSVNARLANFGVHTRSHTVGPAMTMALSKAPTLEYPGMEPSFRRDPNDPKPTSNAPFRFSFGLALMDDGFYGMPSSGDHDKEGVWWDEYSVDVDPNSPTYGQAMRSNHDDESQVRKHMGWMGQPLGERVRVYDAEAFRPGRSLLANGDFEQGLSGWSGNNVSLSRVSDAPEHGDAYALRASGQQSYRSSPNGASINGPTVALEGGKEYTLVFAARSDGFRRIVAEVGGVTRQEVDLPDRWVRRVLSLQPRSDGNYRVRFQVGGDDGPLWLDEVYLFEGSASVMQRDFEHARVVVNATPQRRTVELGGNFRRIKGWQDPINDGARVTRVTVEPFDAAILIRE